MKDEIKLDIKKLESKEYIVKLNNYDIDILLSLTFYLKINKGDIYGFIISYQKARILV